jgi:hypothetical protein
MAVTTSEWTEGEPGCREAAGETIEVQMCDGDIVAGWLDVDWRDGGPTTFIPDDDSQDEVEDLTQIIRWRFVYDD